MSTRKGKEIGRWEKEKEWKTYLIGGVFFFFFFFFFFLVWLETRQVIIRRDVRVYNGKRNWYMMVRRSRAVSVWWFYCYSANLNFYLLDFLGGFLKVWGVGKLMGRCYGFSFGGSWWVVNINPRFNIVSLLCIRFTSKQFFYCVISWSRKTTISVFSFFRFFSFVFLQEMNYFG